MQTWREDPEERPTFNRIVEHLAEMTGYKQDHQSVEHTYFVVKGPTKSSSDQTEEEDVGGVNVYSEVTSPLYKNFPMRPEISVPPPVAEEYEVPVTLARNTPQPSEHQELVVPTEYEVPVSSLPQSVGQQLTTMHSVSLTSSISPEQQPQESEQRHIYHTLEPQEN